MINFFKNEFASLLSKTIELDFNQILSLIEIPPENIPGDLAFPCFKVSGILKKSPNQVSTELVEKLDGSNQIFSKFQALGPYLNAHFNQNIFIESTLNKQKLPAPVASVYDSYFPAQDGLRSCIRKTLLKWRPGSAFAEKLIIPHKQDC